MNDIINIIELEENEIILGVFQDKYYYKFRIENINKKYHNLEDIPDSFFQIDDEYISYRFTHVFTNKRYIAIGLEFWQLNDLYCNDKDIRSKIKIDNYILSIQKEDLLSIKIDVGIFNRSINLSYMVKLKCLSNLGLYNEFKTFLIEKWGISPSEFEINEKQTCSDIAKLIFFINFCQFFVVGFYLVKFSLEFLSEEENNLLLQMNIFTFLAFSLIIGTIIILIGQKKKNKMLMSGGLRSIILIWYVLITITWLFFSRNLNTSIIFILGVFTIVGTPYASETRLYAKKISGFSSFDSWKFLFSDLFSQNIFRKTKKLTVRMEDITDLIKFEADEVILDFFQDEKAKKIKIKYILKKYHKIEAFPKSIFKIDKEFISYRTTHIFTNKRYYTFGVNFWQIFELKLRDKIKIDNYILSIEKENLQTVGIDFGFMSDLGFSNSSIYLNPLADLKCVTNKHYNAVKSFLIEKWDILPSDFEKEEKRNRKKFKRLTLTKHIIEIFLIWLPLYIIFSDLENYYENIDWVILICICAFYSIFSTIIGLLGQKYRILIRIILRSSTIIWLVLILCFIIIF